MISPNGHAVRRVMRLTGPRITALQIIDGSGVCYSRIGEHARLWRMEVEYLAPVRLRKWAAVDYFDVRGGRLVFARVGSATRIFRLPLM